MRLIKSICVFCILSSVFISCADTSTDNSKTVQVNLYQVGGCKSHSLPKVSSSDTSFSYSFTDTLVVDFWAFGGCNTRPNLFALSYNIQDDTIFVTAIDTVLGSKCLCRYLIQAEFANLPLDHYVFYGIVPGNESVLPTYIEDVYKNGGH